LDLRDGDETWKQFTLGCAGRRPVYKNVNQDITFAMFPSLDSIGSACLVLVLYVLDTVRRQMTRNQPLAGHPSWEAKPVHTRWEGKHTLPLGMTYYSLYVRELEDCRDNKQEVVVVVSTKAEM
jgi:hypothetical protein